MRVEGEAGWRRVGVMYHVGAPMRSRACTECVKGSTLRSVRVCCNHPATRPHTQPARPAPNSLVAVLALAVLLAI